MLPAASIRALDTLRENKRIELRVMRLRKSDATLNGTINGRSNKRFDRSGMSLAFIVNLAVPQILPARSIAALDTLRETKESSFE